MPKYRLKNGKYVIVSEDNLEAFKASNDFEGATLFEEAPKKAIDPVKETAIVGSKNQAVNGVSSSDPGLSDLQKIDNIRKSFGGQENAEEIVANENAHFNNISDYLEKLSKENIKPIEEESTILAEAADISSRLIGAFGYNMPKNLESAWESTKAVGIDWLSNAAGEDATDFLLSYSEKIKNQGKIIKNDNGDFVYEKTNELVGKSTEDFLINQFNKINKLSSELVDVGGIVSGVKNKSVNEVLGGVFNAVSGIVSTAGPALLTRGASLIPQVVAPMYSEYNIAKANSLYGDKENPMQELISREETEIATPLTLGSVALGLEYTGFKGISKQIAGAAGKLGPFASLLLTQNKEGITELAQSGIEKFNTEIASGKNKTDAMMGALSHMSSEDGLESYIGGFIGSGIFSAPSTIKRALINDQDVLNSIRTDINKIAELQLAKQNTKSSEFKNVIDSKITEIEDQLRNTVSNTYVTEKFLSKENKSELLGLLEEKNKISQSLYSLQLDYKNKVITGRQFGAAKGVLANKQKNINNKIVGIKNSVNKDLIKLDVERSKQTIKKLNLDATVEAPVLLKTNKDVEEYLLSAGYNSKEAKDFSTQSYGFFAPKKFDNKKHFIIVNEEAALAKGITTTGRHESLHAFLLSAVSKNNKLALNIGENLVKEIEKILGQEKYKNSNFYKRWQGYKAQTDNADALIAKIDSVIGSNFQRLKNKEITQEEYDNEVNKLYSVKETAISRKAGKYEEVMTLLSEELSEKNIETDSGIFTTLNDFFRRQLQNLGIKDVKLETGKDAFNFVKDFNKSFDKGKFTKAQKKFASLGDIVIKESKIKQSSSIEIQEELNKLEDSIMDGSIDYDTYEQRLSVLEKKLEEAEKEEAIEKEKPKQVKKETKKDETLKDVTSKSKKILDDIGNDPNGFNKNNPKIYEVLEGMIKSKSKAFRTANGNVVNLTNLPGFEMENMVSETIASLIPMINKFDPKRNDSLFGYLNSQLSNRMRAALKTGKVAEEKFTEDVTEAKGLAAEETTIREPEKPKYTKIMDADVFDTDVINAVSDKVLSTVRVLKNKLNVALGKNQNTSPLIAEILGDISTQADIDLKKAMGGKEGGMLRKFLLKNKQAIIENLTTTFLMGKDRGNEVLGGLPIAIQKQVNGKFLSYPDWVGKKIDRETTLKRGATAGNQIVRRVAADKISNDDYISFFLDPTGSPIRGRKEALAKEMSGELGLELFVEAIQSETGPIFEAFKKNQEILGEVLQDNYLGEINKQVERGTVKFSLKQTKETLSDLVDRGLFDGNVDSYIKNGLIKLNDLDENASIGSIINALLPEFDKKIISLAEQRRLRTKIFSELIKNKVFEYTKIPPSILDTVEEFIYQQKEIAAELAFQELETNINKAKEENKGKVLIDFVTLYSRAIRGSKILDITSNQKLYDKLVDIAGKKLVKKIFDIKDVTGGKTLVFKGTTTPVTPFTSTPLLKERAEQLLPDDNFKLEWQTISDKTKNEALIARKLIISFIKELKKTKNNSYIKKQLLLLNGDQSSIIRKLSYWKGVETSLIGKSDVETVAEHALEVGTIFKAITDFVDNNNSNSLNKTLANATINLISKKSDKALRNTGKKDKQRYIDANISLFEALDSASDKNISETIAAGYATNVILKADPVADTEALSKEFNLMLQRSKGVLAQSVISKSRAEQLGKGKGKFDLFLPPNAEDFQGLLYKFLGKGKQGDADMKFFKDNLITPFNIAENAISTFRQKLADNLKILNKELGNIDKDIDNETIDRIEKTGFTPDQAVRIYIWNRLGQEIPDVTTQEKAQILGIVRRNVKLMSYAKQLMSITEQFGGYPPPSKNWFASNSKGDLYQYANENVRAKYLENWQANADAIFNNENLTKLQSIYGKDFVNQLKEVLRRMKAGSNRPLNLNDSGSKMLDYINGSIGTIMFLNMRSAVLQTISAVNFLNWHDNNLFAAGKTLADPKNFTKTFMEIMNSDFLKQRRDGLEINVTEAEIAKAVEQSKNKAKAIFSSIIKFGYKPTQFADSFAIAVGGTSFLINRTKTYENQGMSFKDAREAAFNDFREIAEENQQSSRTDKTSNIQASNLGRLVFAFNNTPFQYTRIMKKAALDLVNKRGDWKTNISKIIYYGAIQNMVFFALQQAYMAFLFGADEEDEDMDSRKYRLLNGSIDSILRGSGLPGAIISTVKNTVLEYVKQEEKGDWRSDHGKTVVQALNLSPPIGSKVGRILSALEGKKYEETTLDVLRNKSKLVSAVTNVPLDRVVTKIDNMRVAVNEPIETWKRAALLFGWDQWSLDVYDDLDAIKGAKKDGKSKKTRSEIMKEVWRKRKEEDKKTRDSLITVRSKMSASESLKSLEQEILKKQKKK